MLRIQWTCGSIALTSLDAKWNCFHAGQVRLKCGVKLADNRPGYLRLLTLRLLRCSVRSN